MSKSRAHENLSNFIIDDILLLSDAEIDSELQSMGINVEAEVSEFRRLVDAPSLEFRKARLKNAKALSEKGNARESKTSAIIDNLKAAGKDIRAVLTELIFSGQVPAQITVAFRDGKEISDEEAESILEDLISLGVIKDDESDRSK
ncbi:hypothetical protein [Rheinheimera sp.]|jgi:hypothetical protein|uniref:hypothetical protein n=1 Tax=Rheinheimera sp. TaxID=1869214 RepID=UPI0023553FFC|nr:hypothetical protein [Rheinheimera sp.]